MYHIEGSWYIVIYQQRRSQLLKRRGKFVLGHPASVTTTVLLAYEQIEQAIPAAAELLLLFAHFHPDAIPEDIVIKCIYYIGSIL